MQRCDGGIEFKELFTGDTIDLKNARIRQLTPLEVSALRAAHYGVSTKADEDKRSPALFSTRKPEIGGPAPGP